MEPPKLFSVFFFLVVRIAFGAGYSTAALTKCAPLQNNICLINIYIYFACAFDSVRRKGRLACEIAAGFVGAYNSQDNK